MIPKDAYPAGTVDTDAAYPLGKARNVSAENAGDGFPWEAGIINDLLGFQQAILREGNINASGVPDTALASQYLQALRAVISAIVASDAINETRVQQIVNSAINALVGGAPGALDTLNELAAALGDDAAFSTRVTNQLAGKAPLASPVFTGNPARRRLPLATTIRVSPQRNLWSGCGRRWRWQRPIYETN